jgi:hypothetical protein
MYCNIGQDLGQFSTDTWKILQKAIKLKISIHICTKVLSEDKHVHTPQLKLKGSQFLDLSAEILFLGHCFKDS